MRRGFSLIELLVVIGILAILISVLTPMVIHSRHTANVTRMRADLQAISTALEQYKLDHGDYPRARWDADMALNMPVLGAALFAPGPAVGLGADGADGPGFRTRVPNQGRIYGPYLKDGTFALRVDQTTGAVYVLDRWDVPIEYYPCRPGQFIAHTGPIASRELIAPPEVIDGPNDIGRQNSLLNQDDGSANLAGLRITLGDIDQNNLIDSGETLKLDRPFVLASGGPSGDFFQPTGATAQEQVDSMRKSDDVFNFVN